MPVTAARAELHRQAMQHAMLHHHRTTPGHGVAGLGLSVSLYPKLAQTMPENSSLVVVWFTRCLTQGHAQPSSRRRPPPR